MLPIIRSGLVRDKGLHLESIQWQTSSMKFYFFFGMHTYRRIGYSWVWAEWVMGQRCSECWNSKAHNGRNDKEMSHRGCVRVWMIELEFKNLSRSFIYSLSSYFTSRPEIRRQRAKSWPAERNVNDFMEPLKPGCKIRMNFLIQGNRGETASCSGAANQA